ncbi:MAG: hypothetical protein ACPIOQ_03140 [Promethearchaeia archaeon]
MEGEGREMKKETVELLRVVSVSASEVRWKDRHHGAGASSENQEQEWDRCSNNHCTMTLEAGSR